MQSFDPKMSSVLCVDCFGNWCTSPLSIPHGADMRAMQWNQLARWCTNNDAESHHGWIPSSSLHFPTTQLFHFSGFGNLPNIVTLALWHSSFSLASWNITHNSILKNGPCSAVRWSSSMWTHVNAPVWFHSHSQTFGTHQNWRCEVKSMDATAVHK